MFFCVQISNPKFNLSATPSDILTVGDFLERCVPSESEVAIVNWNGVCIPLSYKYDLSVFIEEIMMMITALTDSEDGQFADCWPSNTFFVNWKMSWVGENLEVEADWKSLSGGVEVLAQAEPKLIIDRNQFITEWGGLVLKVLEEITHSDIYGINLETLKATQRILSNIPNNRYLVNGVR